MGGLLAVLDLALDDPSKQMVQPMYTDYDSCNIEQKSELVLFGQVDLT